MTTSEPNSTIEAALAREGIGEAAAKDCTDEHAAEACGGDQSDRADRDVPGPHDAGCGVAEGVEVGELEEVRKGQGGDGDAV